MKKRDDMRELRAHLQDNNTVYYFLNLITEGLRKVFQEKTSKLKPGKEISILTFETESNQVSQTGGQ